MALRQAFGSYSKEKQTVYYEGGKITALTAQPGVFVRLYSYKKGSAAGACRSSACSPAKKQSIPISTLSTPALSSVTPVNPTKSLTISPTPKPKSPPTQANSSEPPQPATSQALNSSQPFAYIVLKTPPADYITPRLSASKPKHSQTIAVVLTDDMRDYLSLRLRAIQPEVPDRMSAGQVYQRLLARSKHHGSHMRLVTEPIITPHYSQLSPALSTYSYPAGCSFKAWQHRISTHS